MCKCWSDSVVVGRKLFYTRSCFLILINQQSECRIIGNLIVKQIWNSCNSSFQIVRVRRLSDQLHISDLFLTRFQKFRLVLLNDGSIIIMTSLSPSSFNQIFCRLVLNIYFNGTSCRFWEVRLIKIYVSFASSVKGPVTPPLLKREYC